MPLKFVYLDTVKWRHFRMYVLVWDRTRIAPVISGSQTHLIADQEERPIAADLDWSENTMSGVLL